MSFSQLLAPIVLGITSDKIRIASVMKPAINASQLISVKPNTVRELDPKIVDACDPTPIAPTVCAIVFKVRIAARGLSISSLKLTRSLAINVSSCSWIPTYAGVMLNRTASKIEQRKEKKILTKKKVTRSPIV